MSRPLRIEFPGAVHHVTSRGDQREPIFEDDMTAMARCARCRFGCTELSLAGDAR